MTRRRTTPPSARPEAAPTTFTADGRPVVRYGMVLGALTPNVDVADIGIGCSD
jgi:hypothetical protein